MIKSFFRAAALALLPLIAFSQPISQLPAGTTPSGSEQLPAVQNGQTVKLTATQLANYISTNLPPIPLSNTTGVLPTNQIPPLSGDISITGLDVLINDGAVTNAALAPMGALTIKCNPTSGSSSPTDCTGSQVNTILGGGSGAGGVNGVFTFNQLVQQYTSANVFGYPTVATTDVGTAWWTGTQWAPTGTWTAYQAGVEVGIPPNGTVGINGALTLGTALDQAYPNGIYLRFPTGAVCAGWQSGQYYTVMSSTTSGVIYANTYAAGNPTRIASPTPVTCASAPGAYTQANGGGSEILLGTGSLPANVLGNAGEIQYSWTWISNSSAGTKTLMPYFSGGGFTTNAVTSDSETTSSNVRGGIAYLRANGNGTAEVSVANPQGDVGTGTAFNYLAIATNVQQQLSFRGLLSSATDWMILKSASIKVTSSLLADNPPYAATPASALIVPPPAQALGYTQNLYFTRPTTSDISYSNTPTTNWYAGVYYGNFNPSSNYSMTSTPYTPSGQVLTLLGGGGGNSWGSIATQRLNSTAGALPLVTAANGFYCEFQYWLSDNNSDHWPAVWMMPTEHNTAKSDQLPGYGTGYEGYVELDTDELGVVGNILGVGYHGVSQTAINWYGFYDTAFTLTAAPATSSTSGTLSAAWDGQTTSFPAAFTSTGQSITATVTNGSTAISWTPATTGTPTNSITFHYGSQQYNNHTHIFFDWTKPITDGVSYNPESQQVAFYHNGILQDSYSTAAFDGSINPYHYYMIVTPSSVSLDLPYNLYFGYAACWTAP